MNRLEKRDRISKVYMERNIELEFFDSRETLISSIREELMKVNTVGIGNSQTLKELGITEIAIEMGKTVYDKTLGKSLEEIKKLKKKALLSECYLSSSNSISEQGTIVNVDHSGNRVAALNYGPDRVLIVIGENKIVKNEKEAIVRALKVATPQNARRAQIASPCSLGKPCDLCNQTVRVCNLISVIRGQNQSGRMKILVLSESIGF